MVPAQKGLVSLASPILILHAPDAEEEASELRFELELLGFWAVTYYEITHRSTVKEIRASRGELISSIPTMIVISSLELFSDIFLIEWARLASLEKILIPVIFRHEEVALSPWFSDAINLTPPDPSDSIKAWTRLVAKLNRYTGQGFLFSDFQLPRNLH